MVRLRKQTETEFRGLKDLLKSRNITISDMYEDMITQTGIDMKKNTFYNFIRGEHFSRNVIMIDWVSKSIGIPTNEMLLNYYTSIGAKRSSKRVVTKHQIVKKKLHSNIKNIDGNW